MAISIGEIEVNATVDEDDRRTNNGGAVCKADLQVLRLEIEEMCRAEIQRALRRLNER